MRVFRSAIVLSRQTNADTFPEASIENPTTSPLSLMVLQHGGTVTTAPGSEPMSRMPFALDQTNAWTLPSANCDVPATSPWLLMLPATLDTPPVSPPRSTAEPSFSQSTACAPLGWTGGKEVFEQTPDEPTAWPASLIPKANPTVSPGGKRSFRMTPFGSQITGL